MPGDTKPHKTRQAILAAEAVLNREGAEPQLVLRAVHAITQAVASYTEIIEAGELEAISERPLETVW